MADFYPLLSRAIQALAENTPEARQALYERARSVLLTQLRSLDPPLSEADIARQRLSLEDVIRRIETEQSGVADSPWPDEEPSTAYPESPADDQLPGDDRAIEAVGQDEARPQDRREFQGLEGADHNRRPRLDIRGERSGRGLKRAIFGGLAVVVIGAIAVTAYLNRDQPPPSVTLPAEQETQEAERKLSDRIGGETPAAGGQDKQPAQQVPSDQPRRSQSEAQSAAQSNLQVPPPRSVVTPQRAILYEQGEPPQSQLISHQGSVLWRVDSATVGQSQRLDTVVRADVEIPEVGLTLAFIIRRNTDKQLPASHTIEMTFGKIGGQEGRVIKDISVPQFKSEEGGTGTPLAGLPAPVADNFFLVGLSNLPTDITRNLDLLRSRNWIDVPIVSDNRRRGVLAFEKGSIGDQAIADALTVWGQ